MAPLIRTPDQRLRVFISSTLAEVADERRAARAAVEQLHLIPVMFELGARPHPPRALYRSYLEQSNVFVGIYWERYGWVAPDMEISGLEDEFILSEGMPRLLYLKRPAPGIEPRLAEMLARMEGESTSAYRPFSDAEELHGLLLDDLAILLTERFEGSGDDSAEPLPRSRLPAQPSTFLGRETELRELCGLIDDRDVRLVTLTGPGGTGKTRLALRAAAERVEHFDDVFFVDLSAEREVDGVFTTVAQTVGASLVGEHEPLEALKNALRMRRVLLLLDNFEQVTAAAAGVVELLEHCAQLDVLVTSREPLHVRGEHAYPVPPLSLPAPDDTSAETSEAVRLFRDRAQAVDPGFRLDESNVEAIVAICRSLDGLPLAIELAAARIKLFAVDDLRARLENRLDFLKGGARDLPQRQRTLRDAIAWSFDLLSPDERTLVEVLAVFVGAQLPDIEDVVARIPELVDIDAIDVVGSLVDKNLLRTSRSRDGSPRISMLQTIREYATGQLDADPQLAAAARAAHAEHYTDLARRLHADLTFAARGDVLAALSDELGNLRIAWDEWVERADVAQLHDLLAPLWGYYDAHGDYRSAIELGTDLLERLVETPDSPSRRRDEFALRMNLARTELALRGFTADADKMLREALDRAATSADSRQRFPGLRTLAYLHLMRADFEQTTKIVDELMAIAEKEHDPPLLSEAHVLAGITSRWREDLVSSLRHFDEAIAIFESSRSGYVDFRVGPNPEVVANVVSGLTRWTVGYPEEATTQLQNALDIATDLEHPYSVAYALHHAGLLDLWQGNLEGVASRADALLAIAEDHDYPTWRALAVVFGGVASVGSGDVEAGLARVEEGFELYRGLTTPPIFWPWLLLTRAQAFGAAGRVPEALAFVDEAQGALVPGDPLAADLRIVHGDLLLASSPPDIAAAEAAFASAAELARSEQASMAELEALTRLAKVRHGGPGERETLDALRDVHDRFTEGFGTPQLVAAREALERMNG